MPNQGSKIVNRQRGRRDASTQDNMPRSLFLRPHRVVVPQKLGSVHQAETVLRRQPLNLIFRYVPPAYDWLDPYLSGAVRHMGVSARSERRSGGLALPASTGHLAPDLCPRIFSGETNPTPTSTTPQAREETPANRHFLSGVVSHRLPQDHRPHPRNTGCRCCD